MENLKKTEFLKLSLVIFIINVVSDFAIYYFDGLIMSQNQVILFLLFQFLGSLLGSYLLLEMKKYLINIKSEK